MSPTEAISSALLVASLVALVLPGLVPGPRGRP